MMVQPPTVASFAAHSIGEGGGDGFREGGVGECGRGTGLLEVDTVLRDRAGGVCKEDEFKVRLLRGGGGREEEEGDEWARIGAARAVGVWGKRSGLALCGRCAVAHPTMHRRGAKLTATGTRG